ncbi:hypothetical protein F5B21DRAFT_502202 [Xylaria acuta]|nr:hypothetical protein F5B21DRAFT_502202 [Xylaria acuta]
MQFDDISFTFILQTNKEEEQFAEGREAEIQRYSGYRVTQIQCIAPFETNGKLKLVMPAWEEDKKGNFGGDGLGLTGDVLDRFRSNLVASRYEEGSLLAQTGALDLAKTGPLSNDLRISKDLFSGNRNPGESSMREHDPENGNAKADRGRRSELAVEPVRTIVSANLSGPVGSQWFPQMSGSLSGYENPGVFEYVGVAGDTSGNALTYRFNVFDPENFLRDGNDS